MRIALAQIDSTVADFSGNTEKICSFTEQALRDHEPDLVLFPELALCGYPPMDLLDQDSFAESNITALRQLQRRLPQSCAVGVGYVGRNKRLDGKSLINAYAVLLDGELVFQQEKTLLPTYDVFDEARYFEKARERRIFSYKDEKIGFAICEDMWKETETPGTRYPEDPITELVDLGATMICVPSASPYYAGKLKTRISLTQRISRRAGLPVIYLNAVGANDSIIFDGRSFVCEPEQFSGNNTDTVTVPKIQMAAAFNEELLLWDSSNAKEEPAHNSNTGSASGLIPENELDVIEEALVLGIRAYMKKCGFLKLHLGLSGGIDSALIAYLAVRAAGAGNVHCFGMPSRYSSQGSIDDSAELVAALGTTFTVVPIEKTFTSFLESLEPVFAGLPHDLTEENLQARIRGTLLMAYSNKFSSLLLTTGNKSELAMGYCTLYGDMAGGLAPIGDLFKTEVFALCRRINERSLASSGHCVIPTGIIEKPPSAELRPDQKDEDSLPPYEILDDILRLYLVDNLSCSEIAETGRNRELAGSIIRTVARAEYKRRQAPPVLKVSPRAFGMGRRMPIARHAYEG